MPVRTSPVASTRRPSHTASGAPAAPRSAGIAKQRHLGLRVGVFLLHAAVLDVQDIEAAPLLPERAGLEATDPADERFARGTAARRRTGGARPRRDEQVL